MSNVCPLCSGESQEDCAVNDCSNDWSDFWVDPRLALYAERARAAHAAAEFVTDPRDKAAYRAAAKAWERLANPTPDNYSLEPCRRDIDALKRDIATAIDAPASTPAVAEVVAAAAHGIYSAKRRAGAFSAIDEYLHSGIEF